MNRTTKILLTICVVLCVMSLGVALAAYYRPAPANEEPVVAKAPWVGAQYTNRGPLEKFVIPTQIATATPGVIVDNAGLGVSVEYRDAQTPVAAVAGDGAHQVDTINEYTAGSGVTIDSVVLKDGGATFTGEVQYGSDSLYPMGYASSGSQLVVGSDDITGTLAVVTGLTLITSGGATLAEDPGTGAGDAAFTTVALTTNTMTIKAWQDDWTTAATETEVTVIWWAVGTP